MMVAAVVSASAMMVAAPMMSSTVGTVSMTPERRRRGKNRNDRHRQGFSHFTIIHPGEPDIETSVD
jgi:hypothetical protein